MKRSNPWIKSIKEFRVHKAPKGIRYKRISTGTRLEGSVEVDYVSVCKGSKIADHAHIRADTMCLIVSGNGYVNLNGRKLRVQAGQVINIPAGVRHEFGAHDKDLVFVSVQQPPIGGDYNFEDTRKLPIE